MEEKKDQAQETIPFSEIIEGLEDGTVNPKSLPGETRLQCIAYFNDRGLNACEIGDKFKLSDRHIRRLLCEINKRYAQEVDPNWLMERFGELYNSYRVKRKALQKLIHDGKASGSDQERRIALLWRVEKEFFQMMFSLNLVPEKHNPIYYHMNNQTHDWMQREKSEEEKQKNRTPLSELEPDDVFDGFVKASTSHDRIFLDVSKDIKEMIKSLEEEAKKKKNTEVLDNVVGQDLSKKTQESN